MDFLVVKHTSESGSRYISRIGAPWKEDLERLHEMIEPGQSMDTVAFIWEQGDYPLIDLVTFESDDLSQRWLFITPTAWNARNWIVVVDFEEGLVSSVRVGIADNLYVKPRGAPPEKTL